MITSLNFRTSGQGLVEITDSIALALKKFGADNGLCSLIIQHTSASLIIQENADPTARRDLENWLNRLVKENDPLFEHTLEGPDDMPAHIKAALTATTLSIPVCNGELMLGRWQGVYLWEHRHAPHSRTVVVHYRED